QLPRRGRGQHLAHRSQLRPSLVFADLVQVHQVVATRRHHLRQRDQELAAAAAPPPLLEGTDGVDGAVQPGYQVGTTGQLSGQEQASVTGQGGVVGADLDVVGAWVTMHLPGVLPIWTNGCSATPFSNTEGTRLSFSAVPRQRLIHASRSEVPPRC